VFLGSSPRRSVKRGQHPHRPIRKPLPGKWASRPLPTFMVGPNAINGRPRRLSASSFQNRQPNLRTTEASNLRSSAPAHPTSMISGNHQYPRKPDVAGSIKQATAPRSPPTRGTADPRLRVIAYRTGYCQFKTITARASKPKTEPTLHLNTCAPSSI
jgi:hypothetical protein